MTLTHATRVEVILARKADTAVVFRRGPAKSVLLLRWNTATDSFEQGQWLSGRIYERRCDLSPSGEYLVYFAAKWKGPYQTYTALSRPPWLTALALWRGVGAWGGGGLFHDERTLLLNQRGSLRPDEGKVHPRLRTSPLGPHAGFGEDNPIWHMRLLRGGWTLAQAGVWERSTTKVSWRIDPPMIYRRAQPAKPNAILEMRIAGLHEIDGPWYVVEHGIMDERGGERASLGRSDWADWDARGDLLFARNGRIYRTPRESVYDPASSARELLDLGPLTFTRRTSPAWAREWLTRRPTLILENRRLFPTEIDTPGCFRSRRTNPLCERAH